MQAFQFGLRQSAATSYADDTRSRYVPSSIYSGPGPAEDSPLPTPQLPPSADQLRAMFSTSQPEPQVARYQAVDRSNQRSSSLLNMNDPVVMHLLMETAISDSRDFAILSYEEVELLKKDRTSLRSRIEATRRKLALESKLRDAAQSLNRLYTGRDRSGSTESKSGGTRKQRRSFLGSNGSNYGAMSRAEDEYAASTKKIEHYAAEIAQLEKRLEDTQKRILEHTAGILQMTHKGLKKNIRRTDLPRSPESMASRPRGSGYAGEILDEFDERSLYQVPDYVTDLGRTPVMNGGPFDVDSQPLDMVVHRLHDMNKRLFSLIQQSNTTEQFEPPPQSDDNPGGRAGGNIQAHLAYMSQGLEAIEGAQLRSMSDSQKSRLMSGDQLEDVNARLHDLLMRTNSASQSPVIVQSEPRGKDMQSQVDYSNMVLDNLNKRVETLVEQKDILTRQIQQQRVLNSKSDAERDAHIHELSQQLEGSRREQNLSEREAQQSRDQINLLMDQLDRARDDNQRLGQQNDINEALQVEKEAHRETERRLLGNIEVHQQQHARLQKDLTDLQAEMDTRSQNHVMQTNDLFQAKEQSEMQLQAHRADAESLATHIAKLQTEHKQVLADRDSHVREIQTARDASQEELRQAREDMNNLEGKMVRVQTELTMVRAELDGAYGTRAQRAADVSMNPAIQKEIDTLKARNQELEKEREFLSLQHETKGLGSAELQNRVNALQQELRDTIDDYELMTKQSIEFEKERDLLEETIDLLREKCENFETQINDDKIKSMGTKAPAPSETTSTTVLKNEFKKIMRETRAENAKALKAEQEERRRLEGLIRSLKQTIPQSTPVNANGTTTTTSTAVTAMATATT